MLLRHLLSTLGSAVLFLLGSASHLGLAHFFIFSQHEASPSNVMVKYVPEVSSWQLLFVRCSMQVAVFHDGTSGGLGILTVQICFQLVTMVPLMYLSGQNIMGTPDLATRYDL